MTKEQLGPSLSALANKYPFIELTTKDHDAVEKLISDLQVIFNRYPKKR